MTIKQLVTHACTFALLAAPLAGAACNNETPTGTLIVRFKIGSSIECSVANVVNVKVSLYDMPPDGAESEEVESLTVPCSEGEARFDNLPVDRYYITAEGIDDMQFTVVDNGATAETDLGEVLEGKETTTPVAMFSTPAQLWIRFALNKDDFQAMCSAIPIANFNITASKNGGLSPLLIATVPCDAVPADDGYHHIPDESRQLDGLDFDHIGVEALDATGNLTGSALQYVLPKPPGPGRIVKITFTAECNSMDGACDLVCKGGSCSPD